jgi:hypothetical protein
MGIFTPGTAPFYAKDASEALGSLNQLCLTSTQITNLISSYVTNTTLSMLYDVDTLLGNAPEGSYFKYIGGTWTYGTLDIATSSVLGGVKIGSNVTVAGDGTISVVFPAGYTLPAATVSTLGGVIIGSNISVDSSGVISIIFPSGYTLPVATDSVLGGVKIGNNVNVDGAGTISVIFPSLAIATDSTLGGVIVGSNINVDANGVISIATHDQYVLPTAAAMVKGGVKIGTNIDVDVDGVISVTFPDTYVLPVATATINGGVIIGDNISVDAFGEISVTFPDAYVLPAASGAVRGGVRVGTNIDISGGDTISVTFPSLAIATTTTLGGVIVGTNISVDEFGEISVTFPDEYTLPVATANVLGGIKVGTGLDITSGGVLSLGIASDAILGGIRIGTGLSIDVDGIASVNFPSAYTLPTATDTVLGGVKIGSNIDITSGVISVTFPSTYSLPTASDTVLGGIKIGTGLSIDGSGVVTTTFTTPTSNILSWSGGTYIPYASKKTVDPTYPYFYTENTPPTFESDLFLDGKLTAHQYLTVVGDNHTAIHSSGMLVINATNLLNGEIEVVSGAFSIFAINVNTSSAAPVVIGDLAASYNNEYISVNDTLQIFEVNMTDIKFTKGVASKWLALDANNKISYQDPPASAYTHPTQSALSPVLTGANVLSALTFNTLGHVVAANVRVLTLANLGYTGTADANTYIHPASPVTPGTYAGITIDEYGHVSDAHTLTTIAGYGITDAIDQADLDALKHIYTITLTSQSTVAARCAAATVTTDYPTGWTIGAWISNANDLEITHNLGKRPVHVSVWSSNGTTDRLLIANAAYSGIVSEDDNVIRIEALATIATPIIIQLIFAV